MSKKDANKQVEEFITKFKKEAETLVTDVFPRKIIQLEVINQDMKKTKMSGIKTDLNIPVPDPVAFHNDKQNHETNSKKRKIDFTTGDIEGLTGSKVLVLPNGSVPVNSNIFKSCEKLKPLINDLIEHANMVKMWISFLIPKIEDGNNFGVSIQEDTMAEARQVESDAATYLDQISRYYLTRAKIVSKVAKYPHVEDYRQAVIELDEKEHVCLQLTTCEIRNHYASLHDIIFKNLDKIKKPRNANAESLY
ncbi:hypothetical protein LOTGIDRAFT_198754 [Lottia gigantea]|uniref:Proteasome activator PA28 C-terminal domain-containing protein n=1 Tax=Lottia gigantea TaxID=225164 RepID=V4B1T4_LOTGI|nr:hypothetical protein LOTGIDRAFT_198754 [Lottia gigantea]ESP04318.1 hypothetical protein LOTGIDRAFT_198754 [Lottia gigantea]